MKLFKKWLVCLAIAAFLIPGFSSAQKTNKSGKGIVAASKQQLLPLDSNIHIGRLPNGFRYYIRRNTEPKYRAQLYLVNKIGSILENDDQQGLAHFMEHMSFNGTKNYPKNDLVNYLQKSGVRFGADLNAYTSFDETVYQLPIPTDDPDVFKNAFQIMRDWAQDASLTDEEINKERGVVLEEKRLGKGAQQRMQEKYLPLIFNNSRYSNRLPIGTEQVLKNFTPQTLRQFYKDWYRPDLQALIVVGDINVKAVEQLIRTKFSDLKTPAAPRKRTEYAIPLTGKNQFITVTDKEMPVTVAQILIKHPESVLKTTADYRSSMVRSLFNRMLQARYSELLKQADPPFLQGSGGISGFMAGLDVYNASVVAKPGELEKGFKALLTETERVKKFGFTATELDRAKETYLLSFETSFKERDKTSSEDYVEEYVRLFLDGEASPGIEWEYDFVRNNIKGISLAEVNALAKKYITDTNRDVIIMGPEKEKQNLPDEKKLNDWISSVKNAPITAYVDQVSDKPLLARKPASGKVIDQKQLPEIGVTEWKLSNGVKVILKPTDFKNDEISFSAFSPGGTSLYSDADYQSAANAAAIIQRSGVGEFNSVQLPKLLSGKRASVIPYISERSEGLSGVTNPKDLEMALQLVYLYFTQPRKDEEIFKGFITRQKGNLANRENDPNSVFSDTLSAVLGNYNVRRTGPSVEKVEQINLDRAYEIYTERFADASDFTFTFVGNFDLNTLRPFLEQYLGALPSMNRNETAKNLGIKPPAGKVIKTVFKGQEEKATVRLLFTGDYDYNPETNVQLDALAEVLQIKLIERLREEEAGVYSPSAGVSYSKYPTGRYTFYIAFGCSPQNVEKLIASSLDEVNKIKQNGAQPVDIQKFIAEETRTTETQLKENDFWLGYLTGQYQNNENPGEVLTYIKSLKNVTPETVKTTANTYLSGNNLIRAVLLPESK